MVDVADKPATRRVAVASGRIEMLPATLALIESGTAKKETSALIPLCHPIALTRVAMAFEIFPATAARPAHVACTATAETVGQTGVEMEALTAVQVALLTIYDMCKAVDRGMVINAVRLLEKHGGKSGSFVARN